MEKKERQADDFLINQPTRDFLWEKSKLLNELLFEPLKNEERWTIIYSILILAYDRGRQDK